MQRCMVRAVMLFTLITLTPAVWAEVTYSIANYPADQNGWNLTGSIVTDGNTGLLTANDILSWTWTITLDTTTYTATSTATGQVFVDGLIATATQLILPQSTLTSSEFYLFDNPANNTLLWEHDPKDSIGPIYFSQINFPTTTFIYRVHDRTHDEWVGTLDNSNRVIGSCPRTLHAIHRGVRRRMRLRLRHGTQTQGSTSRNDPRIATNLQGPGGAIDRAKPGVPRVRSLSTEASAERMSRCGSDPHLARKAGTPAGRTFLPSAGLRPAPQA